LFRGDGDVDDTPDLDPQVLRELEEAIPGEPGTDYPLYSAPPETSFVCDGYIDGYYADTEARCQVYHVCSSDGIGGSNKYTFLCPNGTVFNQQFFICDWWFNVDCSQGSLIRRFMRLSYTTQNCDQSETLNYLECQWAAMTSY